MKPLILPPSRLVNPFARAEVLYRQRPSCVVRTLNMPIAAVDRDAARITITFPDFDSDADGSINAGSGFVACLFGGPNWSGMEKPAVRTTCSNDTLNAFNNLIETMRAGTIINYGDITVMVDWDPNEAAGASTIGGREFASFQSAGGDFVIAVPPVGSETTGPAITVPGTITRFRPAGEVLSSGDDARVAAECVISITGELSFTTAA